jgi:Cupin-like domain
VIKDMATSWPALEKWTPEYFAWEYGSLQVKVYDKSLITAGTSYMSSLRKIPFSEYLDLMMTSSLDLRLFAFNIFWQAPELKKDIWWPDLTKGFSKNFIFMFFGCKGSVTPLHYDPDLPYLLHTVLYGKKRVVLFADEESENLYKHPFNTRSYVDVDNPDFSKFPRLKYATGYQAILHPAETLFMPSGYWHHMVYDGSRLCGLYPMRRLADGEKAARVLQYAGVFSDRQNHEQVLGRAVVSVEGKKSTVPKSVIKQQIDISDATEKYFDDTYLTRAVRPRSIIADVFFGGSHGC